jgi:Ni/Co efflux regulator RcnB
MKLLTLFLVAVSALSAQADSVAFANRRAGQKTGRGRADSSYRNDRNMAGARNRRSARTSSDAEGKIAFESKKRWSRQKSSH